MIVGILGFFGFSLCAYFILNYSVIDILANSSLADTEFVSRIVEALYKESGSIDTRLDLAKDFTPHFLQQPVVGYGPDQFKQVASYGLYAHNNPAELLINYGLVGSICYYSMYLVIFIKIVEHQKHNIYLVAPLIYLIATEFVFVTHVERPLALVLCSMLLTSCNISVKRRRRSL